MKFENKKEFMDRVLELREKCKDPDYVNSELQQDLDTFLSGTDCDISFEQDGKNFKIVITGKAKLADE